MIAGEVVDIIKEAVDCESATGSEACDGSSTQENTPTKASNDASAYKHCNCAYPLAAADRFAGGALSRLAQGARQPRSGGCWRGQHSAVRAPYRGQSRGAIAQPQPVIDNLPGLFIKPVAPLRSFKKFCARSDCGFGKVNSKLVRALLCRSYKPL